MSLFQNGIDNLNNLLDEWSSARIHIALSASFDATDDIIERVREARKNDEGAIFGLYADSTWKKKQKKNSDRRINFSDKNIMLNSTKPSVDQITPTQVTVVIKPQNKQREEVLGYLEEEFGPIIRLSSEEIDQINEDYREGFDNFLIKFR